MERRANAEPRFLRLRYPARCAVCEAPVEARTQAWWFAATKEVVCTSCTPTALANDGQTVESATSPAAEAGLISEGVAGGSAAREYRRRHDRREQHIRTAHPKLGGLILAATGDPHSTVAWGRGAIGEQQLGARLTALAHERLVILHDRRLPGSRANLDHLAIAASGVYVIDSKRYSGRVEKRNHGNIFRADHRLYVGKRDCTKLVHGAENQAQAVREALSPRGHADVPVRPVVCFIDSDWGIFASPLMFGTVVVTWPKSLYAILNSDGDTDTASIQTVAHTIAAAFPAA